MGVAMKSALIVEDHPVVRAVQSKSYSSCEGYKQHLTKPSSGNEVLSMIREHQA